MGHYDPGIDDYIDRAPAFARPLLASLREQVHAACPEVREALKWRAPAFLHRGRILCTMAAFRQHVAFGFRQGAQVVGERDTAAQAMGQFGRLTGLADLPARAELASYLRKAVDLVDDGASCTRRDAPPRPAPVLPDDFAVALAATPAAQAVFDRFAPSHRRDYVEWIADARRDDTRRRRIAQAVEWLAEGKPRHWKHRKPRRAAG